MPNIMPNIMPNRTLTRAKVPSRRQLEASNDDLHSTNVYDETRDMIDLSALIYVIANIRRLHEDGVITSNGSNLVGETVNQSFDAEDLLGITAENEFILRQKFGDIRFDSLLDALERLMVDEEDEQVVRPPHFAVFDDENHEQELVYAIFVNHGLKRITIVFRGTVSRTDVIVDAKFTQTTRPNPVRGDDQSETIGLHKGFSEYLFGSKEETPTKLNKIMSEVTSLMTKHTGYRLYATGHSMGAALATLFAFHVTSTADIGIAGPVTCIPVASPKVGNAAFQTAFRRLEKDGLLKCLRVENSDDIVTEVPNPFSCSSSPAYQHVGIELELSDDSSHSMIGRVTAQSSNLLTLLRGIITGRSNVLENHSIPQYLRRLEQQKSSLEPMRLSMCMRRFSSGMMLQIGTES